MSSIENNKKQGLQPEPESLPHLLIKRNTSTYRKYSLSSNTLETMGKKNNGESGLSQKAVDAESILIETALSAISYR